jgi:polar amino acid transport system substrate-binding protein
MRNPTLGTLAIALALTFPMVPRAIQAAELVFNTQDFAPFSYAIDGVVSGPGKELIQRVCKEMKADCTFNLLPWKRAQDEVRSGKAKAMFVIGWNEKRAKWLHFSPPIMNTEYGFFVRKDNPLSYKQPSDIQTLTVGVYGPSNTANSLEKIKKQMQEQKLTPIKIDMRPDDEAGFKKLASGRINAVFSNRDVGFALLAKLNLKDAVRYAGPSKSLKYYIGFSQEHNDKKVLEQFDAAYLALYKAGVIKEILDRHQMEAVLIE